MYVGMQHTFQFSSVKSFCHVQHFVTQWTAACQASLSITKAQSLLKPCPSSRWYHPNLILYHSLILLPSIFPSIRGFSKEKVCKEPSLHQVAKVLAFQLQHQTFQKICRTAFIRIDWLDLLTVQSSIRVFSNTTVQKHQFLSTQLYS